MDFDSFVVFLFYYVLVGSSVGKVRFLVFFIEVLVRIDIGIFFLVRVFWFNLSRKGINWLVIGVVTVFIGSLEGIG